MIRVGNGGSEDDRVIRYGPEDNWLLGPFVKGCYPFDQLDSTAMYTHNVVEGLKKCLKFIFRLILYYIRVQSLDKMKNKIKRKMTCTSISHPSIDDGLVRYSFGCL